ncbi:MAG: YslB family protein [Lactobacillus panisapium]|nr:MULTISPECIES: YslB family protein [Lactobacillus]MCO6532417.1 YslB family protein [Lactobacillus sp.]MCO6533236.1 YslB family protein [Lactobacillus sp.]MCO6535983.1 YslB family protein [Lactobacillus sp.]MCT6820984.1 YslB family protein [Lactobacillus panisapium]MCX8737091.1 YslB family protein [Lactobacillus sp. B4026]
MKFFMQDNKQQSEHVYFVNQLYRDFLLPTILGEDNEAILYWGGKKIARKYDLSSFDDVVSFFATTEFGDLTRVKQRRTETVFELSGQSVTDRLNSDSHEFSLEAGILAEAVQKETGRTTECELKIDDKRKIVQIAAKFD